MWWCRAKNVDYKERWQAAVALLGETGRLTPEEVRSIQGEETLTQKPEKATLSQDMRVALHSMKSWDRASLEITRANNKKPPLDDLVGMKSWDAEAVLKARVLNGTID